MKKQLLIAAIAATMTSAAIADISITGGAKGNYTWTETNNTASTNAFNHDVDFTIVGKKGDTSVHATFATTAPSSTAVITSTAASTASGTTVTTSTISTTTGNTAGLKTEDVYIATTIGDVKIKTGSWDNGNNLMRASSRGTGKFSASTTLQGATLTFDDSENGNATIKAAASYKDVSAYYKRGTITNDYGISGEVAGFKMSFDALTTDTANKDRSSFMITKEVKGVNLTYAQADADSAAVLDGDNWFGDYEGNTSGAMDMNVGDDISGFGASMPLLGNTVAMKRIAVKSATTNQGSDVTKFVVTRPLAAGATFELTYTDLDADLAAEDKESLDLELAVKF